MTPTKLDAAAALERMDSMDPTLDCAPAFDFSALGDLSGQATEADRQFDLHYSTAQDEYLISCIYLAKVHELTAKAGRYGGGTWTKWYESKGLSEGSARTMVKNGDAFKSATVAELKQLPNLTRKDLNLIARSGCADQLVENAGNSEKVQELLAQLKAEKERAAAAESREEEAWNMVSKAQSEAKAAKDDLDHEIAQTDALLEEKGRLLRECEAAKKARMDAEARADAAEGQLDAATADVNGLYKENSRLNAEKEQALQRAAKAEEALKHQPITAVVDKEEVRRQADEAARQAKEQAERQVREARRAAAEVQAEFDRFRQAADGFLAPEQVCTQQAQLIANAMRAMYLNWFGQAVAAGAPLAQTGTPLYALCGEIMTSLEEDSSIAPTAAGSEEDAEREALFE